MYYLKKNLQILQICEELLSSDLYEFQIIEIKALSHFIKNPVLPYSHLCERPLDARFRNPPIGGFKHVECLCGTPWIVSLEKTWFFQL